jgi:hypothetical protein
MLCGCANLSLWSLQAEQLDAGFLVDWALGLFPQLLVDWALGPFPNLLCGVSFKQ